MPRPGTAIAMVALLLALAGTATALPGKNKVRSDDIKNGHVRAKDLAADAVGSETIADGSVAAADLAPGLLAPEPPIAVAPNPSAATDPCSGGQTATFCGYFDDGPVDGFWQNFANGYASVQFSRSDGVVRINGTAEQSSFQTTAKIFVLPPGYRPPGALDFIVPCGPGKVGIGYCEVRVEADGALIWENADGFDPTEGISLDAISFRAG